MALRYCASGLLASGAALSIASLSSTEWWAGHVATEHATVDTRFTLWARTSTKYVNDPIDHGEGCASSDECLAGTFCRLGPRRCWTDGDCRWTAFLSHGVGGRMDCTRMPRTQVYATWFQLCSASPAEGLPCKTVDLVRLLVGAAALLAVVASPAAIRGKRLPTWTAAASTCCGSAGGLAATLLEMPHARVGGAGFILHCVGVVFVTAGFVAAARAPLLVQPEEPATVGKVSTIMYGKVAQEEEPVLDKSLAPAVEEQEEEKLKLVAHAHDDSHAKQDVNLTVDEEATTTLLQRLRTVRPVEGHKAPSVCSDRSDPKTPKSAEKSRSANVPAFNWKADFEGAGEVVDAL